MGKEIKRKDVLRELRAIGFGRANDAAKLAFMDREDRGGIDELDLSLLSEIRRTEKGAVEIKLLNRLDALRMLLDEVEGRGLPAGPESLLRAIDRASGGDAPR